MKSTFKKRIMLLCAIICAVVLMVGNIGVGFADQHSYQPGPDPDPDEPVKIEPYHVDEPVIEEPDEPETPPQVPEETRSGRNEFSFVQLSDYRVPLAGLINMTEGDCFD